MSPHQQAQLTAVLSHHLVITVVLAVFVPAWLLWMHVKLGEFWPGVIMIVTAVLGIFAAPHIPGSPDSCLDTARHCSQQQTDAQYPGIMGLGFILPVACAIVYKARHGGYSHLFRRGKGRR